MLVPSPPRLDGMGPRIIHSLSMGFFRFCFLKFCRFFFIFVNMRTSAKELRGPEEPRDPSVSIHLRGLYLSKNVLIQAKSISPF